MKSCPILVPPHACIEPSVYNDNHYDNNTICYDSHLIKDVMYFVIKFVSLRSYYN